MNQQTRNLIRAFLHGFTSAGLFRRLDYPGAPKNDAHSGRVEEILADAGRTEERMSFARIFWTAFLDGITMRGLFERLTIPGSSNRIFKDEACNKEPELSNEEGAFMNEPTTLQARTDHILQPEMREAVAVLGQHKERATY